MSTQTGTRETSHQIATDIRKRASMGSLMSLGAREFAHGIDENGDVYLQFLATILPFNKNGERSEAARTMHVRVTRTSPDLHKVEVFYFKRGEKVLHAEGLALDLPVSLLALDYDGPQVFNPRLVPVD